MREAKNKKEDTPFGLHQHHHHDTELNSSNLSLKILHKAADGPDRKIWESIFIRDLPATHHEHSNILMADYVMYFVTSKLFEW